MKTPRSTPCIGRVPGPDAWSRRFFIASALSLFASGVAPAHKFFFSNTQLDYNPESGNFEITVRMFAEELEKVLGMRASRRIEIDRSPDAEQLSSAYLRDVLKLRDADMRELPLTWVGLETKVDTVYCYLEAKAPATGLRDLALQHTMFFELRRGQVNLVSFRDPVNGRPRDLVFREGDRYKVVIFPASDEDAPRTAP